ncbi:efflux RND transporter permease subunit, partial [Psychromonas arctica]
AFRRVGEVLLILSTLPFALIGGIWVMFILGFNFSIAVGVGFIALAGVSIEIGLIMLLYLNKSIATKTSERHEQFS